MRCFITGYTGFVGQNLLLYLNDRNVRCCGYSRHPEIPAAVLPEETCTSIPESFQGFNTVIHLAGKAHDTKNVALMDEYIAANVDFTRRTYDAFLRSDAKKFIYLSSIKAVADHSAAPLDETALPAPQSIYGQSKLMAENYITDNPPPYGKEAYILRPCMIHGPGNKGNLNTLYKAVEKGLPLPFGAIKNQRSFLSVGNLCFILHELINADIPGGIYHLADNGSISTADLVRLLARNIGKKTRILNISHPVIDFFGKIGDALHLPFNSAVIQKLAGSFVVDNNKIVNAMQKELPISLDKGLSLTIQAFKH